MLIYPSSDPENYFTHSMSPFSTNQDVGRTFTFKENGDLFLKEFETYQNCALFEESENGAKITPVSVDRKWAQAGVELFLNGFKKQKDQIGYWLKNEITKKLILREIPFSTGQIGQQRFKNRESIIDVFKTVGNIFHLEDDGPFFMFSNSIVVDTLSKGFIPSFYACVNETKIYNAEGIEMTFDKNNYFYQQVTDIKKITELRDFKENSPYYIVAPLEELIKQFEKTWLVEQDVKSFAKDFMNQIFGVPQGEQRIVI
jgi:hypothetical protein